MFLFVILFSSVPNGSKGVLEMTKPKYCASELLISLMATS